MLIYTESGKPFDEKDSAKKIAGRKHFKRYSIVEVEGGYAIETDGEKTYGKSEEIVLDSPEGAKENTSMDANEEVVEKPVKKHAVTTPWKPSSYIEIPKHLKDPNYRYRWCKKDKPGNIEKKQAEGWEIDMELTKKMRRVPTVQDGTPIDSTFHVRELIVMRIPEEVAQSRDKYYADKANAAQKSAKSRFSKEVSDISGDYKGSGTYGEIQESRH